MSGNPNGRPKAVRRLTELAQEHTERAVMTLVDCLADESGSVRVSAACALLDRGYGKPSQAIDLSVTDGEEVSGLRLELERLRKNPQTSAALLVLAEATSSTATVTMVGASKAVPPPSGNLEYTMSLDWDEKTTVPVVVDSSIPAGKPLLLMMDDAWRKEAPSWFAEVLAKYRRVAIAGGPKTGKTTLAKTVADRGVVHGDDFMREGWSESSQIIADIVNNGGPSLVVEGVQVGRALRKGMLVDCVIWLSVPHQALTKEQETMSKGCATVFREWLGDRELKQIAPGVALVVV